LAVHLSRVAADLARWSEPSLGYAEMDEAYSTGSSMMPQKRNPDVAELVRGKAGRIAGDLVTLTTLLAGLPLGYHRDLQEDKEPVFDAARTLLLVLPALEGCLATIRFNEGAMRGDARSEDLYATDLAESLVRSGVPFREAHRTTGELLKRLAGEKRGLHDMTSEEWTAFGLPDGAAMLDPDASVGARNMPGGPSPERVLEQCVAIEAILADRA
jgi:argininosuccinate lyase